MTLTPTVVDAFHGDDITSFEEMASAGIQRFIQKATEGITEVDPLYSYRMPKALAAGLQWEAYHFWRPDDAQAQASNFMEVVMTDDADKNASMYWLDYEVAGGTPTAVMALMKIINDNSDFAMGLYTTRSLAEALAEAMTDEEAAFFSKAPLWLAEPGITKPVLGPKASLIWPKIALHQYTWSGTIAGVKGKCDLNCVPA